MRALFVSRPCSSLLVPDEVQCARPPYYRGRGRTDTETDPVRPAIRPENRIVTDHSQPRQLDYAEVIRLYEQGRLDEIESHLRAGRLDEVRARAQASRPAPLDEEER